MECPKCNHHQIEEDECPRCGVIISKYLKGKKKVPPSSSASASPLPARGKTLAPFLSRDKELRSYYLIMSQMLNAGRPPLEAHLHFFQYSQRLVDPAPYRRIEEVLRGGDPASKGMLEFPGYFPEYHSRLIRVGEATGQPDLFYKELHGIMERKMGLAHAIIKELFYPAATLIASLFILPLPTLFNGGPLPYLSRSLLPLILVFLFFFAGSRIYEKMMSGEKIRRTMDRQKLSLRLFRSFYLAHYIRAFWALHRAGVSLLETFSLAASAVVNVAFQERIMACGEGLKEGRSLEEVFRRADFFPEEFLHFVATGERAGKLDESLRKYMEIAEAQFHHALDLACKAAALLVFTGSLLFAASGILSGFSSLLP